MQTSESVNESESSATIHLDDNLTAAEARSVFRELEALAARRSLSRVALDFERVGQLDSAGIVAVEVGKKLLEGRGKTVELAHLSERHRAAFAATPVPVAGEVLREHAGLIERIGAAGVDFGQTAGEFGKMLKAAVLGTKVRDRSLSKVGRRFGSLAEQAVIIGADATWIVAMLGGLMGVILAFQASYQLRTFGADLFMADIVGLGMVREFGVVTTAIIVSGRSGAAMAAELGTMRVNEEIDALSTMGIDPVRYLVVPRIAAITLVMPVLTLIATVVGILAGLSTGIIVELPWKALVYRMTDSLLPNDFVLALIKSVLFAWVIGFTGCFMGLRARGGAQSVGRNTTRTVVSCIFLIVVSDAIVTTAWTLTYVE